MRITALLISSGRLWIGTSNGVVISVPLSEGGGRDSGAGSLSLAPAGSVSGKRETDNHFNACCP